MMLFRIAYLLLYLFLFLYDQTVFFFFFKKQEKKDSSPSIKVTPSAIRGSEEKQQ